MSHGLKRHYQGYPDPCYDANEVDAYLAIIQERIKAIAGDLTEEQRISQLYDLHQFLKAPKE